jgi:hypothetical protein
MNREESLEWIDLALGAIDRHDMMALINESRDEFDGDRYKAENNQAKADRLTEIARTIAALRQNRIEM